ncbi:hypothetical protein LJK87_11025 [Paenibacillus sp. P25]|nr:hypothetical protein LJK87_11025 [Paenibacillus sp. P25]
MGGAFPPQGVKHFNADVYLLGSDEEPLILAREVHMEEGQPTQLGPIALSD